MPAAIQQSQMESDRLSAIKTIDSEIRAIEELKKSLDAESLTKALDFMQNSTGRIIITGMGKSGHIGKKIAASLASTGTPSFFVHPAEASHGDIYLQNEIEQSKYNFEYSDADRLFKLFDAYQKEVDNCINAELVLPAYDYVLKCSHTFNLLDARGVISKDERINFINRVRTMASAVAKLYVQQREKLGFPLLCR